MSSFLSRVLFGVKGQQESMLEVEPEADVKEKSHYGTRNFLDYYDPPPISERIKKERQEFEQLKKERGEKIAHSANRRQEDVMEDHFQKVVRIHELLSEADAREESTLYQPEDTIIKKQLTFDEWKQRELAMLIKRREAAIEVDKLRPDLNRRSIRGWLAAKLSSTSTLDANSSASEPGNWPKRRYYYPVTDFSTLHSIDQPCEEENLLRERVYKERSDPKVIYTFIFPAAALVFVVLRQSFNKAPALVAASVAGATTDAVVTLTGATDYERDYQDFKVAKTCWFAKNKPELYQRSVEYGYTVPKTAQLYDKNDIHSSFGTQ